LPSLPDLDRAQANRAIKIFNKLRLPDVPGTPALAEAIAEARREIDAKVDFCDRFYRSSRNFRTCAHISAKCGSAHFCQPFQRGGASDGITKTIGA
jgi:hypothetical protein